MLARIWPGWGLALPAQVMHSSQWLAEALQNLPPLPSSGTPAAFLDPSCLARYLDASEPPRLALSQLGVPLVELVRSRREAPPSGSYYGELPGAWLRHAAEDCRAQALAVGVGELITASPFDTRNLGLGSRFALKVTSFWRAALDRLEAG
jgi:Fe-S oxidoreductase